MAIWLITGCTTGFGHAIAKAALAHGDKVIATSRDASKLTSLRVLGAETISLNPSGTAAQIHASVDEAAKIHGTIDILVNNAAYVLFGGVEEVRLVIM